MKNKLILRVLKFSVSVIAMISCYSLSSYAYMNFFDAHSHRSVGMVFISFYFFFIASPALLLIVFSSFRVGLVIFVGSIFYLFYEWYNIHPLRVFLMAACVAIGYAVCIFLNKKTLFKYLYSQD